MDFKSREADGGDKETAAAWTKKVEAWWSLRRSQWLWKRGQCCAGQLLSLTEFGLLKVWKKAQENDRSRRRMASPETEKYPNPKLQNKLSLSSPSTISISLLPSPSISLPLQARPQNLKVRPVLYSGEKCLWSSNCRRFMHLASFPRSAAPVTCLSLT